MTKVLIADDEANIRKVLETLLHQDGHETVAVPNGNAALSALQSTHIDILITDLRMPGMSGLNLLTQAKGHHPNMPVIVITAHGTIETAVQALKLGALDYITKPFDKAELKIAVRKAASAIQLAEKQPYRHVPTDHDRLLGHSPAMTQVFTMLQKVADTPSTVLITGESGTGKELVAKALHENSSRHDKPLIKVNCAAIPPDLIESEFFGHQRGAFTGAVNSKPGRFELANGGTLFLDEIAEIPTNVQVKLLRALQESEFERVGGVNSIRVDVRVVAATNRNLEEQIRGGLFREDLYYRLNVVPIHLPPLRERTTDIPMLTAAFIDKYNQRLNKSVRTISEKALNSLKAHEWPGNVRELENAVERAILFSDSDELCLSDLPEGLHAITAPTSSSQQHTDLDSAVRAMNAGTTSLKDIVRQATVEIERDLIVRALETTHGNVTRAASLLKISRKGLQNKMREFGLRDPDHTPSSTK